MTVGWQVLAAARAREAGGDATAMLAAADRARASIVQAELLINITGPALGVHTGPRAVALCGYTEG